MYVLGREGVGGGGTGLLAAARTSVRALLRPSGFVVVGGSCGGLGGRVRGLA